MCVCVYVCNYCFKKKQTTWPTFLLIKLKRHGQIHNPFNTSKYMLCEQDPKDCTLYLKPYWSTTKLKKTGIFHHFLQFTKLHSFCTHLFHFIDEKHLRLFIKISNSIIYYSHFKKYMYTQTNLYSKNMIFWSLWVFWIYRITQDIITFKFFI